MPKIKKILLLIIAVLTVTLGILLYQNKPTNKELFYVDYNSIQNLDKTEDSYFLLVCDLHESQCQYILEALNSTDKAKHDIYYVDTTHYSEDISNPELNDEERANYAAIYRQHMGMINVSKIPTLQLRSGREVVRKLEGFYSDEYNQAIYESGELPADIIIKLQKEYIKFVEKR